VAVRVSQAGKTSGSSTLAGKSGFGRTTRERFEEATKPESGHVDAPVADTGLTAEDPMVHRALSSEKDGGGAQTHARYAECPTLRGSRTSRKRSHGRKVCGSPPEYTL